MMIAAAGNPRIPGHCRHACHLCHCILQHISSDFDMGEGREDPVRMVVGRSEESQSI